jgi:hypothetical protein
MAQENDILDGVLINKQKPLDAKSTVPNMTDITSLGANDYKAFIWYKGLEIKVQETLDTYIWRPVEDSEPISGILTEDFLYPDNLIVRGVDYSNQYYNLFLKPTSGGEGGDQGLQDVITNDNVLPYGNTIDVQQELYITSAITTIPYNGFMVRHPDYASTTIPITQIGAGIGNSSTVRGLNFYTNATVFEDRLNNRGIEYASEYVPNGRSLITKNYADGENVKFITPAISTSTYLYLITDADNGKTLIVVTDGTTSQDPVLIPSGVNDGFNCKVISATDSPVYISAGGGALLSNSTDNEGEIILTSKYSGAVIVKQPGSFIYHVYGGNRKARQRQVDIGEFTANIYTLKESDDDKILYINNGATNVTIKVLGGLSIEFQCSFIQVGTGTVTFAITSTETIRSKLGYLKMDGQYSDAKISHIAGGGLIFYLQGSLKV